MAKKDNIPLFPVADWRIGPVLEHDVIVFRPDYLTGPLQAPESPNPGRNYVLSRGQAQQLIQDLQRALEKFDQRQSGGSQPPSNPQH